jgi:simple sugar transport system substrate-binding protein
MKKSVVLICATIIVVALVIGLALSGFAQKKEEGPSGLLGEGMTVYIQCGGPEGGPATIARTNGARDAAKHLGCKLIEQYSKWQAEIMIQQFQEALAAEPDGIAIMGHPGSDAFAPFVEEAVAKGIVVTSGNAPLTALYMKYVDKGFGYAGVDLYLGGYVTGQNMIRAGLKRGDKAMVYGLMAEAERGMSTRGMFDSLSEAGLDVDYLEISPEVNADFSQCVPVLTAYLSRNPDVKGIGTQHGGITSMFEKVLSESGKEPGEVVAGGIDLTPQTIDGLKSGYVSATLDQQLYLQGFLPVLQIVLTKKYGFAGLYINTGAGVVTPATIDALVPLIDAGIR